ncbi:MAG: hypothetical protein H6767_06780 [Candidatus Peribacteria bacterium]|nr:MAG: hypothetical protein H6767_06780 [Candidatus Peribacteria bacterium]
MDASYFRDLALQNLPSGLQNLLDSFGGLKDVVTEKVGKIELDINLNEVGQDLGNLR